MAEVLSISNTGSCGCSGGGGGSNGANFYQESFSNAVSITILGITHGFGRIPDITVYNTSGNLVFGNVTISGFSVTVTFNIIQTGIIILT